jgi:hypothetical protein
MAGCEDGTSAGADTDGSAVLATSTNAAATTNVAAIPANSVAKPIAAPPALAEGVDEIVNLAQANVGDEVLLAYIENSSADFKLKVDEILYLHDLGLSAQVISAMVRHNQALQEQAAANVPTPTPDVKPNSQTAPLSAPQNVLTPGETQQMVVASQTQPPQEQPTQEVSDNYFHQALSPYGNWVEVPDYGWCWQPTVAAINADWRPYGDRGRWIWTDAGWYWQSDYSWGWIPFHYGRWHLGPACGWVWVPDTVWGPAWVTWRYSDAYCGWAPLPPRCYYDVGFGFRFHGSHVGVGFDFGLGFDCFTFVPLNRFCDRTLWHHRVPRSQIVSIFNHTTIVNNYIRGNNNNVVVNVGPGTRGIAAASRTEIRKVALRDVHQAPGTLIKADRLDRDGSALAVYRPKLPDQKPNPPAEITRRQQEVRKKSEALAASDGVRLARAGSEQRTAAPSRTRSTGSATQNSPSSGGTSRPEVRTPRSDVRQNAETPSRGRSEIRPEAPADGALETRNNPRLRSSEPVKPPARASITPTQPDDRSRSANETPGRSREPRVTTLPSTIAPQPNARREVRSDPSARSPLAQREQRDVIPRPSELSAPDSRLAETRSQPQYAPAPARPAPRVEPRTEPRVELRSYESTAPRSQPSYNPPRNEPRSYSPPPSAPRAVESSRSSSPPPSSRPSPSSDRPSRSDGGGRRDR